MFERVKRLNYKTVKHALVVAAFEGKNNLAELDDLFDGKILKKIKKGEISYKTGEVTTLTTFDKTNSDVIYFVGMGKASELSLDIARKSFKRLGKKLKSNTLIVLDTFQNRKIPLNQIAELMGESITIAQYKFDELKSEKTSRKEFNIYFNCKNDYHEYFKRGIILGTATNNARTLVNKPHNYLNAEGLADYAIDLAKSNNLEIKVYDKNEIEDMGMSAFLAVNKGSLIPPKLIYIKYQGKEVWEDPIALVGKGLMFDTGGYNLKSNSKNMKTDMAGSASVLGAIEAIAKLGLKENVMVIIAATDNMIGKEAYLPDDVITSASGKTIEIFSTDAEGRLTLVDAIWFAQKEGAKRIIDVATLTGSIVGALGGAYVGAFTNEIAFLKRLEKAAKLAGEPIWHMPIGEHFEQAIKGKVADINNAGVRMGGACAAAAFLQEFVEEDTKWIHLDIAGTASKEKTGATGVMVRALTRLLES
ncbi:leucyl aminopeptidase [Mycoplasmatota bacterium zrk1]